MLSPSIGADPDLFARVAAGRLFASTGSVPLYDPFAFTLKLPMWVDHEWLSGLVFYAVSRHWGDLGLFLFKIVFACLSLFVLFSASRIALKGKLLPLVWVIPVILECSVIWGSTVRAQVFTYLFFPMLLYIHEKVKAEKRPLPLYFLPPMFVLWANCHGGFALGLLFLGLFCFFSFFRREPWKLHYGMAFLLSLAATAADPYGFTDYWNYIVSALLMPRPSISEWAPLYPWTLAAIIPVLFLFCLSLGAKAERTERRVDSLIIIAIAAYFGFRHVRLVPIFMMTVATLGAPALDSTLRLLGKRFAEFSVVVRRSFAVVVGASLVFLCLCIGVSPAFSKPFSLDYSFYPVSALEWLVQNRPGGKLLIDFNRGSFALWRVYPHFKISVDGRYEEVYPEETVQLVSEALTPKSPNHAAALEKLSPDYILLANKEIGSFGGFGIEWQRIYDDGDFMILAKGHSLVEHPATSVLSRRGMWESSF